MRTQIILIIAMFAMILPLKSGYSQMPSSSGRWGSCRIHGYSHWPYPWHSGLGASSGNPSFNLYVRANQRGLRKSADEGTSRPRVQLMSNQSGQETAQEAIFTRLLLQYCELMPCTSMRKISRLHERLIIAICRRAIAFFLHALRSLRALRAVSQVSGLMAPGGAPFLFSSKPE